MKEADPQSWTLDTLFVHGGEYIRPMHQVGAPTIQPIYTSTTYLHPDLERLDQAFDENEEGAQSFVYARHGNPNTYALEHVLAKAEGGVGAVVMSSGMAAIQGAFVAAGLISGTKLLVAQDLYGSTASLLRTIFAPGGVNVVFKDLCGPDAADIIREEEPDAVFVETISNPLVKVIDLDAIGTAAREVGAITIVDSTFATPYLVHPLAHGFDVVVHSATKYISGHGDSTAGVAISSRNSFLQQLRSYSTLLGAMLGPFESYLAMRGLKTLALRMERHCANALQVAQFLSTHPAVARVHYPGLECHPQYQLASRLLKKGLYGGLLSFELQEQSKEAAFRFMNELRLCLPVTTLGDIHSQVSYPAISSHRNLTQEERERYGISEGCIRISVGIEGADDIINDLDQALKAI
ncbi:MAG TPA: PLP-dependent aspartate aminotransferase family protein [Ktedonobacteraceae bacterium]|nr:PLP-dependent aspartate aminotransferase family protein [Ktedonobacteraceae bacterium]